MSGDRMVLPHVRAANDGAGRIDDEDDRDRADLRRELDEARAREQALRGRIGRLVRELDEARTP